MNGGQLQEQPPQYRTSEHESPYAALAEDIYRNRVLRARKMSADEKLWAGEELFEYACSITLGGIRHQFPNYSEADCRAELDRRLAWRRDREAFE